jgi:hypothetical protein
MQEITALESKTLTDGIVADNEVTALPPTMK